MRTRKARGKKPGVLTLTESDILTICHDHLRAEGYDLGSSMIMKIPLKTEPGKRRRNFEIEFAMNVLPEIKKKEQEKRKIKPRSIFSEWKPTNES
jgi:hypothetical protein